MAGVRGTRDDDTACVERKALYARENLVLRSPNTCGQFDKEPERCLRSRVGLTPCSYVSSADGKMSCRRNMSYYRSSRSVFDCITDVRFGRQVHPGHELPVVADVRACVAHCLSHPNCSTVSVSTSRHACFWFSPRLACVRAPRTAALVSMTGGRWLDDFATVTVRTASGRTA